MLSYSKLAQHFFAALQSPEQSEGLFQQEKKRRLLGTELSGRCWVWECSVHSLLQAGLTSPEPLRGHEENITYDRDRIAPSGRDPPDRQVRKSQDQEPSSGGQEQP